MQGLLSRSYRAGLNAPRSDFDGEVYRGVKSAHTDTFLDHTKGAGSGGRFNAPGLGVLEGTLEWQPSIQGSRKDVPVFVGWRPIGEPRVFWAPSARLSLTNCWSIGGGGNFVGLTVAPVGLGVYLTRPPVAWSPEARRGRWFVTATLSASVQLGGNATPEQPQNPSVPDPDGHRAALRAQLQQGTGIDVLQEPPHHPLGGYSYTTLGLPLRIDAWGMATPRVGVGFFVEAHPLIPKWQISSGGSVTPAYGYSMTAGLTALVL